MNSNIKFIDGGVCAAQGFTANGVLCKIKASRTTNDTALIYSEKPCSAAGVFTQNRVKAESVKLSKKNIADGRTQEMQTAVPVNRVQKLLTTWQNLPQMQLAVLRMT